MKQCFYTILLFTICLCCIQVISAQPYLVSTQKTYSNTEPITINDNAISNPYPSRIYVPPVYGHGMVTKITVNIKGFSHTYTGDVDILLVGGFPYTGVRLMSDVGNHFAADNLNITFDDEAANTLPETSPLTSGTYKPTNYDYNSGPDYFPNPINADSPYSANLSALTGYVNFDSPYGIYYSLYVMDDATGDVGSIAGGWSITITTSPATFYNPNSITIPDNQAATLYPSTIPVSGLEGTVTHVSVDINGFQHQHASDVDMLLVGPTGKKIMLMSDAGGDFYIQNPITVRFDDAAASTLPAKTVLTSGTYKPANYNDGVGSDNFSPPAPAGPYASSLSVFNGTDPNGTWSLYIMDDAGNYVGNISSGWSLNISTSPAILKDEPITINDNAAANPYPSTAWVYGLNNVITKVTVRLNGFKHNFPGDVDIILVGPTGQKVMLISDVGGNFPANGTLNLTLDDAAVNPLPQIASLTSGTFRPTNYNDGVGLDNFSSPAPPGPYASTLSAFNGTDPNGTWSLYVMDDTQEDAGIISGGWSLSIATCTGGNYYVDKDKDGFGTGSLVTVCTADAGSPPPGYSLNNTDCNDKDASIHPGAVELPDGKDNDCNGKTDDGTGAVTLKISNKSLTEGNTTTQTKTMAFAVSLSQASLQTVTVNYTTGDSTANAGTDYVATNGILTFNPGVTSQNVKVTTEEDTQVEPNEVFKVVLSNPVHASLAKQKVGIGSILNDDAASAAMKTSTSNLLPNDKPALRVEALPNPAVNDFTLVINSNAITPVSVTITDVLGRVVESKTNFSPNGSLKIGDKYPTGIYFARVVQGAQSVTLKLIKQPD